MLASYPLLLAMKTWEIPIWSFLPDTAVLDHPTHKKISVGFPLLTLMVTQARSGLTALGDTTGAGTQRRICPLITWLVYMSYSVCKLGTSLGDER